MRTRAAGPPMPPPQPQPRTDTPAGMTGTDPTRPPRPTAVACAESGRRMHEMGITSGILASAVDAAEAEGATRINSVTVSIGDLTEIVEDALLFAWEALTPGTIAEGSTLVVVHVSPKSRCLQCKAEFEHDKWDMLCPECGSFLIEQISGRELRIDSIDVDLE